MSLFSMQYIIDVVKNSLRGMHRTGDFVSCLLDVSVEANWNLGERVKIEVRTGVDGRMRRSIKNFEEYFTCDKRITIKVIPLVLNVVEYDMMHVTLYFEKYHQTISRYINLENGIPIISTSRIINNTYQQLKPCIKILMDTMSLENARMDLNTISGKFDISVLSDTYCKGILRVKIGDSLENISILNEFDIEFDTPLKKVPIIFDNIPNNYNIILGELLINNQLVANNCSYLIKIGNSNLAMKCEDLYFNHTLPPTEDFYFNK